MNNDLIDVKTLKPFTRFIYTIGELPTSYLISMTYEEQLIWLCNYIEKTVIPTINNNGEAISELQTKFLELKSYIDNYFDNLDIQEEINNKLDEMALDGTLENLIGQYIELMTTYTYNNIAEMKTATNLVNGSFVRTSGFYSYNDGGGAYYKVRPVTNQDVIDDMFIFALSDNTLVAELINPEKFINVLKCGVKNDGSVDCSTKLNTLTENFSLYLPAGTYLVENTINLKNSIKGDDYNREPTNNNKTVIISKVADKTIHIIGNTSCESQTIENINIKIHDNTNDSEVIRYNPTTQTRCYINKISVMNYKGVAIKADSTNTSISRGIYLNTASLFARPYSTTSIGIVTESNCQDNEYSNVEIMYSQFGLQNFGCNVRLNNFHIWCGCPNGDQNNWWETTTGIHLNGAYIHGENIYIDSAFTPILNYNNGIALINNFTYWEDTSMSGSNRYDGSLVNASSLTGTLNTTITNGIVYIGDRIQNINCKCLNTKIIYNSLSNLNFGSLRHCDDDTYVLRYTQSGSTMRYLPVAYIENDDNGYADISVNTGHGTDANIKIIRNYGIVSVKNFYYSQTKSFYYKLDNNKVIIYLQSDTGWLDINVKINGKTSGFFPINLNSLVNYSNREFYQPAILTSDSGLTEVQSQSI